MHGSLQARASAAIEGLTSLIVTISPVAFLTLASWRKKYQKRDFATTRFGAKMRMR